MNGSGCRTKGGGSAPGGWTADQRHIEQLNKQQVFTWTSQGMEMLSRITKVWHLSSWGVGQDEQVEQAMSTSARNIETGHVINNTVAGQTIPNSSIIPTNSARHLAGTAKDPPPASPSCTDSPRTNRQAGSSGSWPARG